jgi:hypothetical protein
MPQRNDKPDATAGSRNIFAEANRGILFDIVIFLLNVFLMGMLTRYFVRLVQDASAGDGPATFAMFLGCLGIFILPPLGATLKRWHFHRRLKAQGKSIEPGHSYMGSCLFNPIFYFCLNLVIVSAILAFVTQFIYGSKEPPGSVFVPLVLGGMVFTIIQTFLIYRYFTAPTRDPKTAFFRSPLAELIGDVCIFVNMLFFQLAWNIVGDVPFPMVSGIGDFLGRLFFICFIALLIYFPPRIFYLAEDIKRPTAWLSILLANSPVIYRVMIGSGGWQ